MSLSGSAQWASMDADHKNSTYMTMESPNSTQETAMKGKNANMSFVPNPPTSSHHSCSGWLMECSWCFCFVIGLLQLGNNICCFNAALFNNNNEGFSRTNSVVISVLFSVFSIISTLDSSDLTTCGIAFNRHLIVDWDILKLFFKNINSASESGIIQCRLCGQAQYTI